LPDHPAIYFTGLLPYDSIRQKPNFSRPIFTGDLSEEISILGKKPVAGEISQPNCYKI
jgi:hypothetical protein